MLSESFEPAVASRDAAGSEDGYAHTIKGASQTGKIQVRRVLRFLGMTNSTAIINGAFVNFKSSFCGMFPFE